MATIRLRWVSSRNSVIRGTRPWPAIPIVCMNTDGSRLSMRGLIVIGADLLSSYGSHASGLSLRKTFPNVLTRLQGRRPPFVNLPSPGRVRARGLRFIATSIIHPTNAAIPTLERRAIGQRRPERNDGLVDSICGREGTFDTHKVRQPQAYDSVPGVNI
jgi:hypothetical protein